MRTLVILTASLLLTACGFHLRGTTLFPPDIQKIMVQAPIGSDPFRTQMESALREAGAKITSDMTITDLILVVDTVGFEKTFSSVSSNVQSRNFILSYTIQYHVLNNRHEPILPLQTIVETRRYDENANQILASRHEEDVLIQEMRIEAMQQIISRLAARDTLIAFTHTQKH